MSYKTPRRRAQGNLHPIVTEAPWTRFATDILGSFHESKLGNKYLLVMTDMFTQYVVASPMPNQKAETVLKILINEFFLQIGIPKNVLTDQGKQFTDITKP